MLTTDPPRWTGFAGMIALSVALCAGGGANSGPAPDGSPRPAGRTPIGTQGTGAGPVSRPASTQAASRPVVHSSREQPNVILIVTDDQAPRTLGIEGNEVIRTPHLDELARDGVFCRRAYVPVAQCAPSRAALLTGRYPHEIGVVSNESPRLEPGTRTLAHAFAERGYRCGLVGKWHLDAPDAEAAGFADRVVHHHQGSSLRRRNRNPYLRVDGEIQRRKGYLTDVLTDEALRFIEESGERAFFLALMFYAPHRPTIKHPDFPYDPEAIPEPVSLSDDLSTKPAAQRNSSCHKSFNAELGRWRNQRARYYSMISSVDYNVGRITAALRERSLDRRTLVVFVSDNGWMNGEHRMHTKGPMLYEELVRVPMIFRWPGELPSGETCDALVSTLDLVPTLAGRAGFEPAGEGDGIDIWPVLSGGSAASPRAELLLAYKEKSEDHRLVPILGLVTPRFKYTRYMLDDEEELYDLEADPFEMTNLVRVDGFADELLALRRRLEAYEQSIEPPFWQR